MARQGTRARIPEPQDPRGDGSAMFEHLGIALSLLRSLTGKSQAQVARASGLGKSQLSKYELGREQPKLESLGRLLQTLGATHLDFAYTLALVQERAARMSGAEGEDPALLIPGPGLLGKPLGDAMRQVIADLLVLRRRWLEAALFEEKT